MGARDKTVALRDCAFTLQADRTTDGMTEHVVLQPGQVRACVSCRWYFEVLFRAMCLRPQGKINPVTGKHNPTDCGMERSGLLSGEPCSPEGRFWEPRGKPRIIPMEPNNVSSSPRGTNPDGHADRRSLFTPERLEFFLLAIVSVSVTVGVVYLFTVAALKGWGHA
jgi:hypothetical protein